MTGILDGPNDLFKVQGFGLEGLGFEPVCRYGYCHGLTLTEGCKALNPSKPLNLIKLRLIKGEPEAG